MIEHFKKQVQSIKEQFKERWRLHRPLIRKYGNPIIVHSVQDKKIFHKIIKGGKIKLPSSHDSPKKTPYMERFLGIDNCIYYSIGFVYFCSYRWKYNLIFKIDYLKELTYFRTSLMFNIYFKIIEYLYNNDKKYLDKIEKINENTKAAFNRYYNEPYKGKTMRVLEFWKIERELFEAIQKYPKKKKLINIIKKSRKKYFLRYPYSRINAKVNCFKEKGLEVIGSHENNLLTNPCFLGFFIDGKIDNDTKKLLKKRCSGKILYDGKIIRAI